MKARSAAWLFVVIAVIQVVPIWSVRYIPTSDGPEHLYNSVVIHDLLAGRKEAIADVYAIDWRPNPNWIGHAFMAVLLFIVPPLVAEKVLFTAIVFLFLGSVWVLAKYTSGPAYAFIAFPFTYHVLLQTGFYNFSAAAGLCIATIAVWWRRRDDPSPRTIAIVAALLVLCYFSHPLPLCIAGASIGILWLGTLRGRRFAVHVRHLGAFVPVAPLLLWFALRQGEGVGRQRTIHSLVTELAQTRILLTFDVRQLRLGAFVFCVIAALIVVTALVEWRRRREESAFLAITLLALALYFWSPESIAGGLMFTERVALFVYLFPIAWLSPRIAKPVQNGVIALFSVIAVANAVYLVNRFRHYERPIRTLVESAKLAQPGSRLLTVVFDQGGNPVIPLLWHATAYAAAEERLIELGNYEPRTGYFPTRFREGATIPDFSVVESAPDSLDVMSAAPYARYIVTWKLPADAAIAGNLDRLYRLVDARGYARLYERRSAFGVEMMGQLEQVLLPLAGTAREVGGMFGARWRIDQSVTNGGYKTIHVALSHCSDVPSCDFDVKPGETVPIVGGDPARPFIYAYLPHNWQRSLTFSTVARRTDRWFPEADVNVPAVPVQTFASKRLTIPNVSYDPPGTRLNLRVYTVGPTPREATVRITSPDGRILGTATLPVYTTNWYSDGDLEKTIPDVHSVANVSIETDASVWAFVTATDTAGRSTVYLPR